MPRIELGHTAYRLIEEIVARSVATTWDDAKYEWDLAAIYIQRDPPGTCLCGHHPIVEHCVLTDRENGEEVIVGNVCVTRFLGIPTDKLFQSFRRIMGDASRALNAEAIQHAFEQGWMNDWERRFYLDTCRNRNLSEKQVEKRAEINRKIVAAITGA